jgi:hypothetical protein
MRVRDSFDVLYIGSDVLPANTPTGLGTMTANSRDSWKGAISHELIGHREAALAGKTNAIPVLEEAQASIRAARFGPELSNTERITLLRDAIARLNKSGYRIRDVKDSLFMNGR